jgi:hypothetical protein
MSNYNKASREFVMTGFCGIYCGECECHKAKDDPKMLEYLKSRGIPNLPCPGCREVEGKCPVIGGVCETYHCAKKKEVGFCFECNEFPCSMLNPASDRAEILPHNLKAFNLSYIQNHGLDEFARHAAEFKEKYYKGKMEVGKGPQL